MKLEDFTGDDVRTFLTAVDRNLTTTATVVLIGGGAAALLYGVKSTTDDIDTFNRTSSALQDASARAQNETQLGIPLRQSTVADVPRDHDLRLVRALPELAKLSVFALEKHDLALSKTVRGDESDLQQILEMHRNGALDFELLLERFRSEVMGYAHADPVRLRINFRLLIRRLFGEVKSIEADKRIDDPT